MPMILVDRCFIDKIFTHLGLLCSRIFVILYDAALFLHKDGTDHSLRRKLKPSNSFKLKMNFAISEARQFLF
jgi:hypothetical protein